MTHTPQQAVHAAAQDRNAILEDRVDRLRAENARLREALHYYADNHAVPAEGPWGLHSNDFGNRARRALEGGEGMSKKIEMMARVNAEAAGRRDGPILSGASEGIGPQELIGPAVERLRAQLPDTPEVSAMWLLEEMLTRLARERDEARSALASARAEALEDAARWHDAEVERLWLFLQTIDDNGQVLRAVSDIERRYAMKASSAIRALKEAQR